MSRRPTAITLIALAILALVAPASIGIAQDNAPAQAKSAAAHVYILRGFMNLSPGLDELAAKVQARGVPATVINNLGWSSLVDHAVQNYKSGHLRSIVIVGHSMGGGAALELAAALGQSRVPVNLVIVLDGVGRTAVPSNVRRVVNLYVEGGIGALVHGEGGNGGGTIRNIGDGSNNHFSIIAARERQLLNLVMGATRPDSAPAAGGNKSDAAGAPRAATVN
jgi:hypothetical protein